MWRHFQFLNNQGDFDEMYINESEILTTENTSYVVLPASHVMEKNKIIQYNIVAQSYKLRH